ncbi:probable membrane-associated kinase regulator 2 [Cicer arietinum]|uniref:Probable membrane-associated kinase regulator 2 n=1 Tax=Cicer arietinum TaxID=3827 RepID=A0A1S2YFE6_CICAR|nr:probable membrane-associated kinase regulator 2 [Cicer arietinum]
MEALKYWKPTQTPPILPSPATPTPEHHTHYVETTTDDDDQDQDEDEEEEEEEGSFFDLELTLPQQQRDDADNDSEFGFTLSPSPNDQTTDPNLLHLELHSSEPNSKPHFTASFFKSATKFRVFMLGLNKSNPNVLNHNSNSSHSNAQNLNQKQESDSQKKKKLFTVKFKVDEVPILSLFTRDNISKAKTHNQNNKVSEKDNKEHNTEESQLESPSSSSSSSSSDDKLSFSKEVMQKYFKKVKPLYVRVSRKYAEKLKFSAQLNSPAPEKAQADVVTSENGGNNNVKGQKQGTLPLPAGLRVVCKQLGKSRSASSSVPSTEEATVSSRRRDDSLVQQHDGIQSAILHCKSSFNASKECESSELQVSESVSDPLHIES